MNKIQPTSFQSVGEFLDFLPEEEHKMVEYLRDIIFECIPDIEERLSYNVPFYYRHSRICYVWPASIPWGSVDKGVTIGFCRGDLLSDDINYLAKANRKQVLTKKFTSLSEIDSNLLKSYLYEARELDDTIHKS